MSYTNWREHLQIPGAEFKKTINTAHVAQQIILAVGVAALHNAAVSQQINVADRTPLTFAAQSFQISSPLFGIHFDVKIEFAQFVWLAFCDGADFKCVELYFDNRVTLLDGKARVSGTESSERSIGIGTFISIFQVMVLPSIVPS